MGTQEWTTACPNHGINPEKHRCRRTSRTPALDAPLCTLRSPRASRIQQEKSGSGRDSLLPRVWRSFEFLRQVTCGREQKGGELSLSISRVEAIAEMETEKELADLLDFLSKEHRRYRQIRWKT